MEAIKTLMEFMKRESLWLKSRIGTLRVRIAVPDVRVEWREVGESVMLILLSLLLYGSVALTQFSFVPIMIVAIKRGWKESLLYLTGALVLLLFVMSHSVQRLPIYSGLLLFSPSHFTFEFIGRIIGLAGGRFFDYYVLFGILGIFLGFLVHQNYRLGYVVFFGLCAYAGIIILILSVAWLIGGFDQFVEEYAVYVDRKTLAYVHYLLNQIGGGYGELLAAKGIDYGLLETKAQAAAEMFKRSVIFGVAPRGGYLIKELAVIIAGILLVRAYFKNKLNRAAFTFGLRSFRIDDDWVWGIVIAWGLVYINLYLQNQFLGIIGWNTATIVSLLFFLRGLSILAVGADKLRIPSFFLYLAFVFLLFYSFILFVAVVTGIGIVDIWLKMRESLDNIKKRENT
jgi:hypothetical protein